LDTTNLEEVFNYFFKEDLIVKSLVKGARYFVVFSCVSLLSCSVESSHSVSVPPVEADATRAVEIGKPFDFEMGLVRTNEGIFKAERSFLFSADRPVDLFLQKTSSCIGKGLFETFELLSTQAGEPLVSTDEMDGYKDVGMFFPGKLEKGDYVLTAVAYADRECTVMSEFELDESSTTFE
jgi:hypothetical protein